VKNKSLLIGIIFGLITLGSLILRFQNYEELVNFHLDPPLFLHEVKEMVDSRTIRLIGPLVATKVIEGRYFFTGPTFYWLLAILGITLNWNVLLMTAFFAFWWLGTFILIFFWLKKRFGVLIALIVYALLSFVPFLIPYSRLIWNVNLIPFFGVLLLWFLEKRGEKRIYWWLAGLSFGLGLSIHYSVGLWFLILFYYLILDFKDKKFCFSNWLLFVLGAVLAEAPILLFELRHNFYNLRTILFQIRYYQPSISYDFSFRTHYYYNLPLVPLVAKGYGLLLEKLKRIFGFKIILFSQIILAIVFLAYSLFGPQGEALINPKGWYIERQREVSDLIVKDGEKGFEVAATINSDTRALELRWWLRQKGHEPMGVEDYNKTDILYLVAPESRPPEEENVWEVKALRPFKIAKQVDLGDGLIFYKLRRLPKEEP